MRRVKPRSRRAMRVLALSLFALPLVACGGGGGDGSEVTVLGTGSSIVTSQRTVVLQASIGSGSGSYAWQRVSGPAPVHFDDRTSPTPRVTFARVGTHIGDGV